MAVVALRGGQDDIEEPDWLRLIPENAADNWRAFARRHWLRITQELRDAGTLAPVNAHQIQRLIMAYVRYDMAAAQIMLAAAITGSPKTGVPMLNLWQVEMRAADSDATTAEMELCLNPRRRGSATKAARREKALPAAGRYLAAKA